MTEQNNVEIIDLTSVSQTPVWQPEPGLAPGGVKQENIEQSEKETVQEVGEIFTQIVNELVGLRQDLKPMGEKIIDQYLSEIDNLRKTVEKLKDVEDKALEKVKDATDEALYYENQRNIISGKYKTLKRNYDQLIEKMQIKYLGDN